MATQYPAWAQPAPKKPTRAASQPLKTVDQLATLAPAQAAATVSRGPAIMGAAGQPPARNDMLMGAAKNPAWAQGAAAPPAPAKPNLTNLYQTSMTVANPSLARVAPGAPTIPGRERMNEQVAGYTDMVNPAASGINPVAPRAAWQPNMDAWMPGAGPLALQASQFADQAAQRKATEAANQATMNRMQAQRRPAFGTHGGRLADPAAGYQEYLAAARAFRDGTGPDPGAWRGSPGDMPAPAPPTEAQMARRAAWNDTKAARRRMVTARAQGQRMTPEQALGSVMAMRGDNLTDEQLLAGWGGAPMWMRTQQRIAEVPFGANAQAMAQAQQASSERIAALPYSPEQRQADLAKARLGVRANLATNPAIGPQAIPMILTDMGEPGASGQEATPLGRMIAAQVSQTARQENPNISARELQDTMIAQGVDPKTAVQEAGRHAAQQAQSAEDRWNAIKSAMNLGLDWSFLNSQGPGDWFESRIQQFVPKPPALAQLPPAQVERLRAMAASGNAEAQELLRRNGLLQGGPATPAKPAAPGGRSASWADIVRGML
jgi:hypothetical protein